MRPDKLMECLVCGNDTFTPKKGQNIIVCSKCGKYRLATRDAGYPPVQPYFFEEYLSPIPSFVNGIRIMEEQYYGGECNG